MAREVSFGPLGLFRQKRSLAYLAREVAQLCLVGGNVVVGHGEFSLERDGGLVVGRSCLFGIVVRAQVGVLSAKRERGAGGRESTCQSGVVSVSALDQSSVNP